MDIVSHALWGGLIFGRRSRKTFIAAAGFSLLPDVLSEGLFGVFYVFDIGNLPSWKHGHPNITAYPLWAQNFYNFTHSIIVFTIFFLIIWILSSKPIWAIGTWGLHILIDIPTHSIDLFPTPFLWPLSDYVVDGMSWRIPIVWAANVLLLLAAYLLWWRRLKKATTHISTLRRPR